MSKIVERANNGKLKINTLDLDILLVELFTLCQNEHEVEFVSEAITGAVENMADETLYSLN